MGTTTIIAAVIGAIILILIIGGPLQAAYRITRDQIFPKVVPPKAYNESQFVPYVPPALSLDEQKVLFSTNALACAINSMALGEFKYDDPTVCPKEGLVKPSATLVAQTPTGKFITSLKKITGFAVTASNQATYGNDTTVQCDGFPVEKITLPDTSENSLALVGQAILSCKAKTMDKGVTKNTRCARMMLAGQNTATGTITVSASFAAALKLDDENTMINYFTNHKNDIFKGQESAIDHLLSWGGVLGLEFQNKIEPQFPTSMFSRSDTICIDYISSDYISMNNCEVNAAESFSCQVTGFELPQEVTGGLATPFIQAFGDPRWLVYYESFPPQAAQYWHKEWSDMFNLYTIGAVTFSGVLNAAFVGKVAKVEKVAKTAVKDIEQKGSKLAVTLLKEGIEEGTEYGLKRLGKYGYYNAIRSFIFEDMLQKIYGIGPKISKKITDATLDIVKTKSGTGAFTKYSVELEKKIGDILEADLKLVDPDWAAKQAIGGFINPVTGLGYGEKELNAKLLSDYKKYVLKEIMEGGEGNVATTFGSTTIRGLKGALEANVERELTKDVLRRQSFNTLLSEMVKKDGTFNYEFLANNLDLGFKKLENIAKIGGALNDKLLASGKEYIDDFLVKGTLGKSSAEISEAFSEKSVMGLAKSTFNFVESMSPIKLARAKWLKTGPGYILASLGKTTVKLPAWILDHPLPTMLLLSVLVEGIDSTNEKFIPVGTNAIAINQPDLLGETIPIELNKASAPYMIYSSIKPVEALYFVSPCKASMKVYKKVCTCQYNPGLDTFDFGDNQIYNVKKGTIVPKDNADDVIAEWEMNSLSDTSPISFRPSITSQVLDYSHAVKVCDQTTHWAEIAQQQAIARANAPPPAADEITLPDYTGMEQTATTAIRMGDVKKPYCIEVEPTIESGYCYDYFPKLKLLRTAVTGVFIVADVAITAATGGAAAPLILFGTGVASAAVDLILEGFEKWP
jgi:ribosomal protein S13